MARREPLVAPPSVTGSERFVKPTAMRHAGAVAWREEGPVQQLQAADGHARTDRRSSSARACCPGVCSNAASR